MVGSGMDAPDRVGAAAGRVLRIPAGGSGAADARFIPSGSCWQFGTTVGRGGSNNRARLLCVPPVSADVNGDGSRAWSGSRRKVTGMATAPGVGPGHYGRDGGDDCILVSERKFGESRGAATARTLARWWSSVYPVGTLLGSPSPLIEGPP